MPLASSFDASASRADISSLSSSSFLSSSDSMQTDQVKIDHSLPLVSNSSATAASAASAATASPASVALLPDSMSLNAPSSSSSSAGTRTVKYQTLVNSGKAPKEISVRSDASVAQVQVAIAQAEGVRAKYASRCVSKFLENSFVIVSFFAVAFGFSMPLSLSLSLFIFLPLYSLVGTYLLVFLFSAIPCCMLLMVKF
jgi:hypothetical protein